MLKRIAFAAVLVLANIPLVAQFSVRPGPPEKAPGKLTIDDLTAAAKKYFRDTAEFPMTQTTTFSVVASSGKSSTPKTIARNYLFRGYSRERRAANASMSGGRESMWGALRGFRLSKLSANSAIWTMIPGLWLYSDPGTYNLTFVPATDGSELVQAKMAPVNPCPVLSMSHQNSQWYFPDDPCGESEFQLDKDLRFKQFAFQALGLPALVDLAPFGLCNLQRYHAELEFQEVTLPQDKAPFLVPKRVTATLETDKGSVVISSIYGPKVETGAGNRPRTP